MYLRDNLNLDGGDHIIMKYSLRSPETTVTRKVPKKIKRARTAEQDAAHDAIRTHQERREAKERKAARGSDQKGIDEILHETAKGLYIQGEKWGVNRAIRGAVQGLQVGQVTPRRTSGRTRLSLDNRQRSEDLSTGKLLARIEALEQRNRSLAELLGNAMYEFTAAHDSTKVSDAANDHLNLAVAKVQFVQVYLENPGMPILPHDRDGRRSPSNENLGLKVPPQDTPKLDRDQEHTSLDGTDDRSGTAKDEKSANSTSISAGQQHVLVPLSTPPTNPQKSPSESRPVQDPLSLSPRPTLAQSPYSWMLGEDKPKMSFIPHASISPTASDMLAVQSKPVASSLFGAPVADRKTHHHHRNSKLSPAARDPMSGIDDDLDVFSDEAKQGGEEKVEVAG